MNKDQERDGETGEPGATEGLRRFLGDGAITRRDFLNGVLVTAGTLALQPYMARAEALAKGAGDAVSGASRAADAASHASAGGGRDHSDDVKLCHEVWKGRKYDLPAPESHLYDCLVVGGGVSGLTAAWKLRKLGIKDVLVLERTPKFGGLARGEAIGGVTCGMASAYASFP
ncbi:MAG: NAD(P)/FAD-dependent oxidoreductase, partial [Spirochaetaceae bacterium]|nr:NAD(P)/FAD-dependent oxidoreductase [Spirochaetaceae bacterium]